MALVFGSPEAAAILAKDRELWRQLERAAAAKGVDSNWRERIAEQIDSYREEIAGLEEEIGDVEEKIEELKDAKCPLTGIAYRDIEQDAP